LKVSLQGIPWLKSKNASNPIFLDFPNSEID
jgi:hypothetical protein